MRKKINMKICFRLLFCALLFSDISLGIASLPKARLYINCYGFHAGEGIAAHNLTLVTGSVLDIYVSVRPVDISDTLFNGISKDWPTGLRFIAGTLNPEGKKFISEPGMMILEQARKLSSPGLITPEPELIEKLRFDPFQTYSQRYTRQEYLSNRKVILDDTDRHFLVYIPDDLAGRSICIQAILDHPQWGHLESHELVKLDVIAPRNEEDVELARTSQIKFSLDRGQNKQTIELVDSLIALGYHDVRGLDYAKSAAIRLKLYDVALRFLDLNWETNGAIDEFSAKYYSHQPEAASAYNKDRLRFQDSLRSQQEQK